MFFIGLHFSGIYNIGHSKYENFTSKVRSENTNYIVYTDFTVRLHFRSVSYLFLSNTHNFEVLTLSETHFEDAKNR